MDPNLRKNELSSIRHNAQTSISHDLMSKLSKAIEMLGYQEETLCKEAFLSLKKSKSHYTEVLQHMRSVRKKRGGRPSYPLDLLLALYIPGTPVIQYYQQAIDAIFLESIPSYNQYRSERKGFLENIPEFYPHSLRHIWAFPHYFFGSIQGHYLYQKTFGTIAPYDPKGFLSNVSGIIYEEKRERYSLDWNIGPTPTVGVHLSLEAIAFQNILRGKDLCSLPENSLSIDTFLPYDGWVYINLQNRCDRNESARVSAIEGMSQNSQRILVASLSVDSPYYRMKYDPEKTSLSSIRADFQKIFSSSSLFDIASSSYYFFSLTSESERSAWQDILHCILERAYTISLLVDHSRSRHTTFHELLLYGIARAWHGVAIRKIGDLIQKPPSLLVTMTCREGVDRGGALNGGMRSFLLSKNRGDLIKNALHISFGRPILFRGRLNEEHRLEGFFSLTSSLLEYDIASFLNECLILGCSIS